MADVNKIKLVSDRVQQAQNLLLSQFKDKPNILALVDSLVTEVQKLENTIIDLQTVRTLDGSYGVWLDEIGKRHKVPRGNYGDTDYKNAIKLAASKRTSSASVDSILQIVTLLTNDTDARIENNYPYLQELYSYMFCLDESPEGIKELASLFPVNSRVRIIQTNELPFKTGVAGQGIGAGRLSNLLYVKDGITSDSRFTTAAEQIIPPPVLTAVYNVSPPFIVGDLLIGSTLTCSVGLWEGDSPITYTYQWYRNGGLLSGITTATYDVTVADENSTLSCIVTASNLFSNAASSSEPVFIAEAAVVVPTLSSDVGLYDFIVSSVEENTTTSVPATITFTKDGMVTYTTENTSYTAKVWATTPATDIGADFRVSYVVLNGDLFDKAPNIEYSLSANQSFIVSSLLLPADLASNNYVFTVRQVSNSSVSQSHEITVTLENTFYAVP
jgi:hypothetical protein